VTVNAGLLQIQSETRLNGFICPILAMLLHSYKKVKKSKFKLYYSAL